mmetsp:Transcript_54728/g.97375  ORF Transcript_54728/g.97375 Transcript_54728/m.97375 type:complete len:97 (+) Transcript_54728:1367-1657(+)
MQGLLQLLRPGVQASCIPALPCEPGTTVLTPGYTMQTSDTPKAGTLPYAPQPGWLTAHVNAIKGRTRFWFHTFSEHPSNRFVVQFTPAFQVAPQGR